MKKMKIATFIAALFAVFAFAACEPEDKTEGISHDIDMGNTQDVYETLKDNDVLEIPLKITCAKGLKKAWFKKVTKPVDKLVVGPENKIPVHGNTLDTVIKVYVPLNLHSIVFAVYDNDDVITARTIRVNSVTTGDAVILTDVEMSTDPADNKCFLALYETPNVFGSATALTKQSRIDWVLIKNGNAAQAISPHAYGASAAYYNNSKGYLAGFTDITYMFLSNWRSKITKEEIDQIKTNSDILDYLKKRMIAPAPDGEGYNIITASRRVGPSATVSDKDRGFIIGWGAHTHPTVSPAVVTNTSFALVWVKSVTAKPNGHYIMKFDIIYPSRDERADNNTASIIPYSPYPL